MEKKKTIKIKPAFIVDFTDIDTLNIQDISVRFVESKLNEGMNISPREAMILVTDTIRKDAETFENIVSGAFLSTEVLKEVEKMAEVLNETCNMCVIRNKKPWYKRFWAWLTKPFKKNK